jgi:hypothetical protein
MYGTLHLPPDWCHATCDVASASEFPVAGAIAQERDDVEAVFFRTSRMHPFHHVSHG